MVAFRFKHVCIESVGLNIPTEEVTSAQIEDRLAAIFERLRIPFGTLEKLTGIKSRCLWDKSVMPSSAATEAGRLALADAGIERDQIQALFNCSVSRDYFEPATAVIVHRNLGLSHDAITMDISNACIGFSNGILTLANLIESGIVKAGMVVTGENVSSILDASTKAMLAERDLTRERLLRLLPTFTLGCGAAAMVLAHESIATRKHRLIGSALRSVTSHSELCMGNADFCATQGSEDLNPLMETDSQMIISSASKVGAGVWPVLSELLGWKAEDIDHLICHQVGKQLNTAFFQEMGLSNRNEHIVYPRYGNQVSCALPAAFITGITERNYKAGDKILLTGFGSGLNAIFSGVVW